jgi:glutathione synthase
MTIKLGVVMDPIGSIHYEKDSTLAMLQEAQARGWELYYFEQAHLFLRDGVPYGEAQRLTVRKELAQWFEFAECICLPLAELDVILMRKDPPLNEEFIYTTYLLEHAEAQGVLVVNRPQALRDANEKLFTTYFPQITPPTLVTQSLTKLQAFWQEQRDIVCKPLNNMGGQSVFRLRENDVNANVVFDMLTHGGTLYIMAQKFIPEIKLGDKRILMIDGDPIPHVLARIPQGGDWRGNLAVGAKGRVQPLSERDRAICAQVGPELHRRGLYFVGLDIIGDYLTEINVTSPTGIRQLDTATNSNCSAILLDKILSLLQ